MVIETKSLRRTFEIAQKEPGLLGSLKSLVKRKTVLKEAVKGIDLSIAEGEFIGFLGPNGAGKTTTLKMLSGILYPSSGEARVLGFTPSERKAGFLKQIALVMGQKQQLWWDLPARESFLLLKEIYEVSDAEYTARVGEMASLLEIEGFLDTQVRKLSLGERMKCELVAALIHAPRVVFLDEPTIGLDVISQVRIRSFLKEYQKRHNATILLTSHYMQDVQELCERVVIINHGEKVFDAPLQDLVTRFSEEKRILLTFTMPVDPASLVAYGDVEEATCDRATLRVPRAESAKRASALLAALPVADIAIEDVDIEEVIRQVFVAPVEGK